jgi:hypothetical protein
MEGGIGFKRLDFQLSTWIFLWWVFYTNGLINYNPKLFITVATVVDLLRILYGFIYVRECSLTYWILTLMYLIVTKFIPFNDLYFKNDSGTSDIIFGVILSIVYLLWLTFNGTNPIEVYSSQLRGW